MSSKYLPIRMHLNNVIVGRHSYSMEVDDLLEPQVVVPRPNRSAKPARPAQIMTICIVEKVLYCFPQWRSLKYSPGRSREEAGKGLGVW